VIPSDFFHELKLISDSEMILSSNDSLVATNDGFQTTHTLYKEYSKIIGCTHTDNVVAILHKTYCPTDVVQSNDLIAFTENGGQAWTEGLLYTNLIYDVDASHQVEDGLYIILINRDIYELRRE